MSIRADRDGCVALWVCLLIAALACAPGAYAATFEGLGHLGGGTSNATAVSADGTTVVGHSVLAGGGSASSRTHAFIWTQGGGMVDLWLFTGGDEPFNAFDVSGDGSVVVGRGALATGGREAFSWSGGTFTRLGDLATGSIQGTAFTISDDGMVIAGQGAAAANLPVIWTSGATTPTALSVPAGIVSGSMTALSSDGSVGAGTLRDATRNLAHRWTSSGFVSLGTLQVGGGGHSLASGISGDGSVIVGQSDSASGPQAFMWTSSGGMVGLGDLDGGPFESWARAVSGDGQTVVGFGATALLDSNPVYEAFIWDTAHGMRKLQDVLTTLGLDTAGWRLQEATGVSADGSVITGFGVNPQGATEAFVVRFVPEPGTAVVLLLGGACILLKRSVRGRHSR